MNPCALPRVIALVASLLAGCAYLPWGSSEQWHTVSSKRFVAYTKVDLAGTGTIEGLEKAHALLESSLFGSKPIAPIDVLLLDWPEFQRLFGDRRTQAVMAKLPGKGTTGQRGLIVMYARDGSVGGATHRLTHLFLEAMAPEAPLWIHEGLATYLEGARYREGGGTEIEVCLGDQPGKAPDVPVDELFGLTFTSFDDSSKASGYRLAASSLVDFFMTAEAGKLREPFLTYIGEVAEGADQVAALAKVFSGMTPAQLQDKAREFRKTSEGRPRGTCPIPYSVSPERAADTAKPTVKPVEKAEIDRLQIQLQLLPRRRGQIEWYPPAMIGVAGGQFPLAPPPKPAPPRPTVPASPPAGAAPVAPPGTPGPGAAVTPPAPTSPAPLSQPAPAPRPVKGTKK